MKYNLEAFNELSNELSEKLEDSFKKKALNDDKNFSNDDEDVFDFEPQLASPRASPTLSHSSVKSLASSSSLISPDSTPLTPQTQQNNPRKWIIPIAPNKN